MTFYCICNFYSRLLIPLHNAAIKSFGTHTHMHTHTHCSPPTPLSHHFPPLSHTCAIVSLSSDMQCLSITWRRRLDCPFTKEKTNLILILLDKKVHISLLLFRLRRTLKKKLDILLTTILLHAVVPAAQERCHLYPLTTKIRHASESSSLTLVQFLLLPLLRACG